MMKVWIVLMLATLAGAGGDAPTPVIVELFTSEGCSSCPPADALLMQLGKAQPVPGARILVLEEHVDYCNQQGWVDPFSSSEFTARQQRYSESLRIDGVYTPQMVVDGRVGFVGSDAGRARAAIAQASRERKAAVLVTASLEGGNVRLKVSVENLVFPAGDGAEVLLAITESNLRSSVGAGENAGRNLAHSGVVRRLIRVGTLKPQEAFSAESTVTIAKGWKRENLQAVVFVQERSSRRVLGAGAAALTE